MICIDTTVLIDEFLARGDPNASVNRARLAHAAETPIVPVAAWFFDAALKSFVVLAVAGVVCLGLRRASAASRHLVWFLAAISLLVMPLISPMLPPSHRALWSVAINQPSANEMSLMLVLAPATDVALPPPPTPGGPAAFESPTASGIDPAKPRGLATG